jgi:hypothetical protein
MWNLWWAKWHGDRFSPSTLPFPVNFHSTDWSTIISSGAGTMGQTVAAVPSGLRPIINKMVPKLLFFETEILLMKDHVLLCHESRHMHKHNYQVSVSYWWARMLHVSYCCLILRDRSERANDIYFYQFMSRSVFYIYRSANSDLKLYTSLYIVTWIPIAKQQLGKHLSHFSAWQKYGVNC